MDLPEPLPGLVIRFAYLWRSERNHGAEEGRKDRPCAIVLAVTREEERTRVVVAAITHSPPSETSQAIAVPAETARRLGLDERPQWIVTNEVNVFTWPGPDLRPIPGRKPAQVAYGFLPARLTQRLIDSVRAHAQGRTGAVVARTED